MSNYVNEYYKHCIKMDKRINALHCTIIINHFFMIVTSNAVFTTSKYEKKVNKQIIIIINMHPKKKKKNCVSRVLGFTFNDSSKLLLEIFKI